MTALGHAVGSLHKCKWMRMCFGVWVCRLGRTSCRLPPEAMFWQGIDYQRQQVLYVRPGVVNMAGVRAVWQRGCCAVGHRPGHWGMLSVQSLTLHNPLAQPTKGKEGGVGR